MPNIRLDFITDINPDHIELMKKYRQDFIDLDAKLQEIGDMPNANDSSATRSITIARTHIETALQYTIKALCLTGENKWFLNGL